MRDTSQRLQVAQTIPNKATTSFNFARFFLLLHDLIMLSINMRTPQIGSNYFLHRKRNHFKIMLKMTFFYHFWYKNKYFMCFSPHNFGHLTLEKRNSILAVQLVRATRCGTPNGALRVILLFVLLSGTFVKLPHSRVELFEYFTNKYITSKIFELH